MARVLKMLYKEQFKRYFCKSDTFKSNVNQQINKKPTNW